MPICQDRAGSVFYQDPHAEAARRAALRHSNPLTLAQPLSNKRSGCCYDFLAKRSAMVPMRSEIRLRKRPSLVGPVTDSGSF